MTPDETKPAPGPLVLGSATTSLVDQVLSALPSPDSRRSYKKSLEDLEAFARGRPLTRKLLLSWRQKLGTLSSSTANVRLSAAKALVREAWRIGVIDGILSAELLDIDGLPRTDTRIGNWLTIDQARSLLKVPDRKTLRGKRNYCILAILLGCALRRFELTGLDVKNMQLRDGRWVLANIKGKGNKKRTVALPPWVKQGIDVWLKAAGIKSGKIIRRLSLDAAGISDDTIWQIVQKAAAEIGVPNFGPHDLRRTCAKLCRSRRGRLEQIQILLGHASIQTTERYLGSTQDLRRAVNDDMGL